MKCNIWWICFFSYYTYLKAQLIAVQLTDNQHQVSVVETCNRLSKDFTVVAFLNSECPIGKKVMRAFAEIIDKHQNRVCFVLVFPGEFERKNRVVKYCKRYHIELHRVQVMLDKEQRLVSAYNATVTPEFFLLDKQHEVLYSGSLDDRFVEIGVQKSFAEKDYLLEAIEAALYGREIVHKKTRAVGCFINKK
jgi:hypothetical protein